MLVNFFLTNFLMDLPALFDDFSYEMFGVKIKYNVFNKAIPWIKKVILVSFILANGFLDWLYILFTLSIQTGFNKQLRPRLQNVASDLGLNSLPFIHQFCGYINIHVYALHYENTPIQNQIHWKFYHQKMAIFQIRNSDIFSSPEQKLRVSYCHHPMSVVRRSSSTISLLTL